jgi:hypothetical protein
MFPPPKRTFLGIVLILTSFYLPNFSKPESDQTQINCEKPPLIVDTAEPQLLFSTKTEPVISPNLSSSLSNFSSTETVKIWVFFTDKGVFTQEDYNKSKASFRNSLCPAALKRRVKNKVGVDFFDLPPNQNYVEEILSNGAKLRQKSR